ncbi:Asp-tRNA(Asn)/Glu-tRNA(Gln) amidotransferase GatCAB subunit B, partial [bacterium]|nr:Asp-tRNA(Asn)/Glu-tRNA(Gln) amidotransferase GatCAB subunit B [bacterium]
AAIDKLGIKAVDSSEIDALCQQLIDENANVVAQLLEGKDKAIGALIGKARTLNPNVSPNVVREKIMKMIGR